jgi:hypothetical protein
MEWNGARLKFTVLSGQAASVSGNAPTPASGVAAGLAAKSFFELCKLGLAFTWPLAVIALLGLGVLVAMLVRSL